MADKEYQGLVAKAIETHGHFVQGVINGPFSYAYTIGRSGVNKPEFYMPSFNKSYGNLLNQIPARWDDSDIKLEVPFTHGEWKCSGTNEPTLFKIALATIDEINGMNGCAYRYGNLFHTKIRPLTILIAGEDNTFEMIPVRAKLDLTE